MADKTFHSFDEFARFLDNDVGRNKVPLQRAAKKASWKMYRLVRKVYGDRKKLAPLAPATQEDRVARGYTANNPLLRDGTLLKNNVQRHSEGMVAAVGTPEIINLYHEKGYINHRTGTAVPPRPVFAIAMKEMEKHVMEYLKEATEELLEGMHGAASATRGFVDTREDE